MRFFAPRRLAVLAAALVAALALTNVAAQANTPAEEFVQQNVQRGLSILKNHNIPDTQRRAEFREFLTSLTDIRRIALFTLGAARRTASPNDIDAFVNAFRNYAVAVYEARLNQYAGQFLKVTGSTERAPGDFVVATVLVDANGKVDGPNPIEVDFRTQSANGKFVVVDVSIAGVWLALEERDQFSSYLEQNNENLPALTNHLQELAQQVHSGASQQAAH